MRRERSVTKLVAERLRALRERQELSQADVARLAGMTRSQILVLERGERAPTVVTVAAIARALGVPIAAMFDVSSPTCPGPDRADRVAVRLRALGPEAVEVAERFAEAMEHIARRTRGRPKREGEDARRSST